MWVGSNRLLDCVGLAGLLASKVEQLSQFFRKRLRQSFYYFLGIDWDNRSTIKAARQVYLSAARLCRMVGGLMCIFPTILL